MADPRRQQQPFLHQSLAQIFLSSSLPNLGKSAWPTSSPKSPSPGKQNPPDPAIMKQTRGQQSDGSRGDRHMRNLPSSVRPFNKAPMEILKFHHPGRKQNDLGSVIQRLNPPSLASITRPIQQDPHDELQICNSPNHNPSTSSADQHRSQQGSSDRRDHDRAVVQAALGDSSCSSIRPVTSKSRTQSMGFQTKAIRTSEIQAWQRFHQQLRHQQITPTKAPNFGQQSHYVASPSRIRIR